MIQEAASVTLWGGIGGTCGHTWGWLAWTYLQFAGSGSLFPLPVPRPQRLAFPRTSSASRTQRAFSGHVSTYLEISHMKQLLTVRDICRRLQLGRTTVYGLVKDNKLPAIRLARRLRFDEDLVEKHIREHALTSLVASQIPIGRESPGEGPVAAAGGDSAVLGQ